jgi:hypothetical protein
LAERPTDKGLSMSSEDYSIFIANNWTCALLINHSVNMVARFPELSEEDADSILSLKTSENTHTKT